MYAGAAKESDSTLDILKVPGLFSCKLWGKKRTNPISDTTTRLSSTAPRDQHWIAPRIPSQHQKVHGEEDGPYSHEPFVMYTKPLSSAQRREGVQTSATARRTRRLM